MNYNEVVNKALEVIANDYIEANDCQICHKVSHSGLGDNGLYRVYCPKYDGGCGASTEYRKHLKTAIQDWNLWDEIQEVKKK